jgi:hypothetical protein
LEPGSRSDREPLGIDPSARGIIGSVATDAGFLYDLSLADLRQEKEESDDFGGRCHFPEWEMDSLIHKVLDEKSYKFLLLVKIMNKVAGLPCAEDPMGDTKKFFRMRDLGE